MRLPRRRRNEGTTKAREFKVQQITYSSQQAFKVCRKRYQFSYELRIRTINDAKALRMGSAYHSALEALANGAGPDGACQSIYDDYSTMPEEYDQREWEIERETLLRLVMGYVWRWEDQPLHHLVAEQSFELPLVNPATKAKSKTFSLAGKIDGIVKMEDGRGAVLEHKLLSEDLGSDSDLWLRLRVDHQISLYVSAARRLGFRVDTVLYNVTRKPTILPSAVPVVDSVGLKIVHDANGQRVKTAKGDWRQTGSSADGYKLLTRDMTPDEWGEKLAADIASRPEFYFARPEIARLDRQLNEFESELWDVAKSIRDAQLKDAFYRTVTKDTCAYCQYFGICTNGIDVTGSSLPSGFVKLSDPHPELGRISDVNRELAEAATADGATASDFQPF